VVGRRHITAEDRVISRASPRKMCGGQGGTETLDFPCQYTFTIASYSSLSGFCFKNKAIPLQAWTGP